MEELEGTVLVSKNQSSVPQSNMTPSVLCSRNGSEPIPPKTLQVQKYGSHALELRNLCPVMQRLPTSPEPQETMLLLPPGFLNICWSPPPPPPPFRPAPTLAHPTMLQHYQCIITIFNKFGISTHASC